MYYYVVCAYVCTVVSEQRGEQSGSGTYTYANQAVYDGVWENGRKHGSGYFSSAGQLLLELWCRGVRVKRCEVRGLNICGKSALSTNKERVEVATGMTSHIRAASENTSNGSCLSRTQFF